MKSCVKRDAKEPVGVVVKKDGKYDIVEYSELSDADANRLDPKTKELKFNLGNILIFILKADKLLELCNNTQTLNKLYHKAFKKVGYWDFNSMELVKPTEPNAYKFELFIHNFLPFCDAGKFGVMKVIREEEFAPVKNAEGSEVDSPNTARDLMYKLNIKYLRNAGGIVEKDNSQIEIDNLVSYEGEGLKELVEN
jgi:UDP-N-acetylglucosamine/UDP-N-acetylgalactosamine diphosphorylase